MENTVKPIRRSVIMAYFSDAIGTAIDRAVNSPGRDVYISDYIPVSETIRADDVASVTKELLDGVKGGEHVQLVTQGRHIWIQYNYSEAKPSAICPFVEGTRCRFPEDGKEQKRNPHCFGVELCPYKAKQYTGTYESIDELTAKAYGEDLEPTRKGNRKPAASCIHNAGYGRCSKGKNPVSKDLPLCTIITKDKSCSDYVNKDPKTEPERETVKVCSHKIRPQGTSIPYCLREGIENLLPCIGEQECGAINLIEVPK